MDVSFDLEQSYLDLVQAGVSGNLAGVAPEAPFGREELARARTLSRRVRARFAAEVRQLKKGKLQASEPLRGLLLDFQLP